MYSHVHEKLVTGRNILYQNNYPKHIPADVESKWINHYTHK